MPRARFLIEEVTAELDLDATDAALDFAEGVVGRYHFPHNWERFKDKIPRVTAWLHTQPQYQTKPEAVISRLDWLAQTNQAWAR